MKPNISTEYPPNFEEILKVFPMANNGRVIFAYHDTIYNPSKLTLSPSLIAHENIHLIRQGKTEEEAMEWWGNYLTDPDFVYKEELIAHVAEYLDMAMRARNRPERRRALKYVAKKLASPLYKTGLTPNKAAKEIMACANPSITGLHICKQNKGATA